MSIRVDDYRFCFNGPWGGEMARTVPRAVIVEMLADAAAARGPDLRRYYDLAQSGALDDPRLRDLWLIRGDAVREDDLERPAA